MVDTLPSRNVQMWPITERPLDGKIVLPPGGRCGLCGTRFRRARRKDELHGQIVITHCPYTQSDEPLVRTGIRCAECGMDLMGPAFLPSPEY